MSTDQQSQHDNHDMAIAPVAIALWVIVVAALAYGIVASASKVAGLFGS
jgi:hypothetical protein